MPVSKQSDICQDGRAQMAGMEVLGTLPAGTTAGADKGEIDLLFDPHLCGTRIGALVDYTDIKPGLHLPPELCGTALYACWQGGDPIKVDSPLCAFELCLTKEYRCTPEVVMAMTAWVKDTGRCKLLTASSRADDPNVVIDRSQPCQSLRPRFACY